MQYFNVKRKYPSLVKHWDWHKGRINNKQMTPIANQWRCLSQSFTTVCGTLIIITFGNCASRSRINAVWQLLTKQKQISERNMRSWKWKISITVGWGEETMHCKIHLVTRLQHFSRPGKCNSYYVYNGHKSIRRELKKISMNEGIDN